jgi:sterol 3beta-glucosyltransferase
MLITILTIGTRGDIQPFIALGVELKKAGARVCLVTFENFSDFVKDHVLEFYPTKGCDGMF